MAQVLADYFADMAATPFRYGQDDCASFVVGWFDRVTGRDGLSSWRGRYAGAPDCQAYISRHGGFQAIAASFLGDHYGAARCLPKPGNAVLARFNDTEAMGLRLDDERIAMRTERGLLITHRAAILDEWGLP